MEADLADGTLPSEWRLLWVANHCPQVPVLQDTTFASPTAAQATIISPPTPAEELGHQSTAIFKLPGSSEVTAARYVLELPAGSSGRFQVVSAILDSTNFTASTLLRSNVVSFNGGVSANMPRAVVAAISDHATSQLLVTAKGLRLGSTSSANLASSDLSWQVPLSIVSTSDSTLVAQADVPTELPDAVLQVTDQDGSGAVVLLPAALTPVSFTVKGNSWLVIPEDVSKVVPKDFAFVYNTVPKPGGWRNLFHIVYIRHNVTVPIDGLETSFGHLWSEDLQTWGRDTLFFTTGAVGWDKAHVWAPSIVPNGNTTYMFYTGVDSTGDQRTGRVSTSLFDTTNTVWSTSDRRMVFSADSTSWVVTNPDSFAGKEQFRDPYVFPHPDSAGRFLMVYVAYDQATLAQEANSVGLAMNRAGSLDRWVDKGRFGKTQFPNTQWARIESPHVFPDSSGTLDHPLRGWRVMYTRGELNGFTQRHSSIQFVTVNDTGVAVTDTSAAHWSARAALFTYLSPDTTVSGWDATEELRAGTVDFLAGFNGYNFDGIQIARMYWNADKKNFMLKVPAVTAVDDAGSSTTGVRLGLIDFRPRTAKVRFRIELPVPLRVTFAVYDVMGRRLRTLRNEVLPAGETLITWDGLDREGTAVRSGVYFALLSYVSGNRTARFPLVR